MHPSGSRCMTRSSSAARLWKIGSPHSIARRPGWTSCRSQRAHRKRERARRQTLNRWLCTARPAASLRHPRQGGGVASNRDPPSTIDPIRPKKCNARRACVAPIIIAGQSRHKTNGGRWGWRYLAEGSKGTIPALGSPRSESPFSADRKSQQRWLRPWVSGICCSAT